MKACNGFKVAFMGIVLATLLGADAPAAKRKPGAKLEREGDEIMVCGQLHHTGTPVLLWTDPGGYDAYRTGKRFGPLDKADLPPTKEAHSRWPYWFGLRKKGLSDEAIERVRGGGWTIDELRDVVDQFVIHFDAAGTSRRCFQVLHDIRGLSVQFMLDPRIAPTKRQRRAGQGPRPEWRHVEPPTGFDKTINVASQRPTMGQKVMGQEYRLCPLEVRVAGQVGTVDLRGAIDEHLLQL